MARLHGSGSGRVFWLGSLRRGYFDAFLGCWGRVWVLGIISYYSGDGRRGEGDGFRMGEWQNGRLGDFITLKRGYDLRTADRNEYGNVPIISSSGLMTYHTEAKAEPPGVVTGRYGSVGEFFYIDEPYWPLNTTLYVKDFKGNNPFFIYYYLQILNFKKFIDKTSIPGVNRNDLHRIKVSIPPVSEQRGYCGDLGDVG